jgi:hypothetical protein
MGANIGAKDRFADSQTANCQRCATIRFELDILRKRYSKSTVQLQSRRLSITRSSAPIEILLNFFKHFSEFN